MVSVGEGLEGTGARHTGRLALALFAWLALPGCTQGGASTTGPDARATGDATASETASAPGLDASAAEGGMDATARDAPSTSERPLDTASEAAFRDAGACGVPDFDVGIVDTPEPTRLLRSDFPQLFSRVTIGRLYQHDQWTLPAADTYQPGRYPTVLERRIAYVCDTLIPLRPTFVTGMMRFDATEPVLPEHVAVYLGVKRCLREALGHPVRFDVVLNTLHYTDPMDFPTPAEGSAALLGRLCELNELLHPDLWFFDFYNDILRDTARFPGFYRRPMNDAIAWIHDHQQFVGGSVGGHDPRALFDGTDYVSIDTACNDLTGCPMGGTCDQLCSALSQASTWDGVVPLLLRIRNDPQVSGSEGLQWINGTHQQRLATLRTHTSNQARGPYRYSYPIFYPLKFEGSTEVAYDARQDGDMLTVIGNDLQTYMP